MTSSGQNTTEPVDAWRNCDACDASGLVEVRSDPETRTTFWWCGVPNRSHFHERDWD
jgi:hypothetical protein